MSGDRLDRLDYYSLLRVAPDAPADAIREAFHAFARTYHPDRFSGAPAAKRERAATIYRRGAEGYRVLMNPLSRRAYDEGLQRGELRLARSSAPGRGPARTRSSQALTVRSPRARPFASQAQQALRAGDLRTAKLNLKMALQHEPGNELLEARLAEVERRLAGPEG